MKGASFLCSLISVALIACTAAPMGTSEDHLESDKKNDTKKNPNDDDGSENENGKNPTKGEDDDANKAPSTPAEEVPVQDPKLECTHDCMLGAKRCSPNGTVGTEVCTQAADGCWHWTQGNECATGSSCDKVKNNGTCKLGCKNDSGCSLGLVGSKRCAMNGTAEETCSQVGECFVFKTTRTSIPQECTGSGAFCGATTGGRMTCRATTVGACTAHEIDSIPCSTGTKCSAGACVTTCTNDVGCHAGALNVEKCSTEGGRSRLRCGQSGGCYKWIAATSCSPDETCSAGQCK